MRVIGEMLFKGEKIKFVEDQYKSNGRLGVTVVTEDDVPYATLSTNPKDVFTLAEDCFYVKDWSENEELARAVITETELFEEVATHGPRTWRIRRFVWVVAINGLPIRAFRDKAEAEKWAMASTMGQSATFNRVRVHP